MELLEKGRIIRSHGLAGRMKVLSYLKIESVFPTGSNDVYVYRAEKKEILLPAIGDVVRKIDTKGGVMVVRLLKGLSES